MIGKWHLGNRPHRLRLLEHPARPGRLPRPAFLTSGRAQAIHRLLHGPDRRFHARLAQAARPEEAVLRHVPSQGAAPPLGARRQSTRISSPTATIPEPDNLFDHYEGRARSVAAVTMKVGEDMTQDRSQARHPAGPQGRRAAQVGLPALHQGLSALHTERGRQRRPRARLPGCRRPGVEHHRDLHVRPGLLPGRPRLVRQAPDVRGIAAHAVPDALSRRHQGRAR